MEKRRPRICGSRLPFPWRGADRRRGKWQFVGVLPLFDPPRETPKARSQPPSQMGVKVKMVTGDQIAIAKETARTVGPGHEHPGCQPSCERPKNDESGSWPKQLKQADGFAQVFPEHKFHIVEVLQKRNISSA